MPPTKKKKMSVNMFKRYLIAISLIVWLFGVFIFIFNNLSQEHQMVKGSSMAPWALFLSTLTFLFSPRIPDTSSTLASFRHVTACDTDPRAAAIGIMCGAVQTGVKEECQIWWWWCAKCLDMLGLSLNVIALHAEFGWCVWSVCG